MKTYFPNIVLSTLLIVSANVNASNQTQGRLSEAFADEVTTAEFTAQNATNRVYRFMVSFKDTDLSHALITNDNLRRLNDGSGVAFKYNGITHTRDINDFRIEYQLKNELAQNLRLQLHFNSFFNDIHVISVATDDDRTLQEVADALFSTGYFNYVEEDRFLTLASKGDSGDAETMSVLNPSAFNDPSYPEQLYFANQSDGFYGAASIEAARELMQRYGIFNSDRKVNVHVIDSGFIQHEDVEFAEYADIKYTYEYDEGDDGVIWLNNSIDPNRPDYAIYESCGNRANEGDGYLKNEPTEEQMFDEDGNPVDWVRYETDGTAIRSSHGLNAASIIGASSNNEIGMVGIIPQDNVNLVSVLAVDDCGGYSSYNLMAMYWSIGELEMPQGYIQFNQAITTKTEYPADVINMSFGSDGYFCATTQFGSGGALAEFAEMASNRGVVLVASAGNNNYHASDASVASCPYIVSVGAITEVGTPTNFTNYGTGIDVMALGDKVYAASANKTIDSLETTYSSVNGTSFSGPIVAGLAGLIKLYDPTLTGEEVRNLINSGAKDLGTGVFGGITSCGALGCGYGAVNFENTMRLLLKGEILSQPVASHYLANNLAREDSAFLAKAHEFNANMCTTYRMSGYVLNDRLPNLEYRFYGSQDGENYTLIDTFNKGSFLFNDTYAHYRLRGCNTQEGVCSELRDVSVDDSFIPATCL